MTRLDVRVCGLVFGCVWAFSVLALGVTSTILRRGIGIVGLLAKVYIGYKETLFGSFIGAVWGFVDGAISGMLIAWIYNKFIF